MIVKSNLGLSASLFSLFQNLLILISLHPTLQSFINSEKEMEITTSSHEQLQGPVCGRGAGAFVSSPSEFQSCSCHNFEWCASHCQIYNLSVVCRHFTSSYFTVLTPCRLSKKPQFFKDRFKKQKQTLQNYITYIIHVYMDFHTFMLKLRTYTCMSKLHLFVIWHFNFIRSSIVKNKTLRDSL